MPRANDNRKPVGIETCAKCGEEAEFFQVQTGRFKGYLYRKGCECGADQDKKPFRQLEWLARMKRTPHPMMEHPIKQQESRGDEPEKPGEKSDKDTGEPVAAHEGEGGKVGIIGVLAIVGGIALALFT